MKTILKNKVLVLLSAFIMLFCGVISTSIFKKDNSIQATADKPTSTPTLTIESNNVSYADSIYILYAVSNDGFDRAQNEIKMLFWEEVQEDYVVGTELYSTTDEGSKKVKGKDCLIFYSEGLAAKEMTTDIYSRAYVEIDGVAYYSDVMKFSILEYVYTMKENGGLTTNQQNLFNNMLNYGASAQYQFNHNVDRIANGDYYSITIINGKLPDGFAHGRYKNKEKIKVKAEKAPHGMKFSHWVDEKGIIISYDEHIEIELKGNKTYEAVYKDISSVATQLVLTAEVPYDGDTNDIELPTAVSIDVGGETVTLEVTWNTESFKANTVGTQTLYATLVDQTAYDKYDIEVGGIMMNVTTLPYTYEIDTDTGLYILTGYYGTDTEITLPTSYKNTFITTIASKAFNKAMTLTNVVIPNTYTKIEQTAFFLCDNIESITIPFVGETLPDQRGNVTHSWFGWIFGASNYETQYGLLPLAMKEVTIADGATIVPRYAFYKCSQIEKFNLPSNITALKAQAFAYCTAITEFTIPDSLKEFSYAFDGCTNLKKIEVSNIDILFSLDSNWSGSHASPFAMGADLYCKGNLVTELNIPVGTTHLNYMWQNCTSIEKITIPNTVISSADSAFYGMKNLKTVVFEEGFTMETLEGGTFSHCSSLTSIEIPDSVTSIEYSAFSYCDGLTSIEIPDSVTNIGGNAFRECSSLTSVEIPDSVTFIGENAFYECSSLTTIKLPNGITSIASRAFSYCRSLTSIEIPELIYDIQEYAFYGCNNLLQITILSKRLTSIENEAFSECRQLFEIYNLSNLEFTIGSDDFGGIAKHAKVIHSSLDESAHTHIDENGFITYNDGTDIILYGYVGNGGDIVIPKGITKINANAFSGNQAFTSVVISDSVISIGSNSFRNCSSLTSMVIGDSVTSIGYYAFYNCISLTSVYYKGTAEEWSHISIDSGNSSLTDTMQYYYSETQPTVDGNFWYYDENGEIAIWEIHIHTEVVDEAVSPTCTESGLTEGKHCDSCGEVLVAQEMIEAKGHNFVDYQCTICKEWDYTPVDYFTFSEWDGKYRIEAKANVEYPEVVVLPNVYNGKPVETVLSFNKSGVNTIKTLIITDGYTAIKTSAFPYSVKTVVLSESVSDIQYGGYDTTAFFNATGLEEIIVSEDNASFKSIDGVLYSKDGSRLIHYPEKKSGATFNVPGSVTVIARNSFRNTTLEEVILHDRIEEIEARAFIYASALKGIVIPAGITTIYEYTFDSCSSLQRVVLPSSISIVEYSAFSYCDNLTEVYYYGTEESWANIVIDNEMNRGDYLTNPTRYYYSEQQPTVDGNWWHYDENGEIAVW